MMKNNKPNSRIDVALYKELYNMDITDEELKQAMEAAKEDMRDEFGGENKVQKSGKANKRRNNTI